MSNNLLQPGCLSQHASLPTTTTLKQLSTKIPVEIWVMILSTMTAADLINFRRCCIDFDALFMANQSHIVRGILQNNFYHTASTLYGILPATGLKFESLKYIARRCDIAEMLASSIAEHHVGQGSATTFRMAENIKPYLLSLGHFFEKYRTALANYRPIRLYKPLFRSPGIRLEGEVLNDNYNQQTVQRICLTYKLLTQILDQKFIGRKPSIWDQLSLSRIRPTAVPVDMFTFGGLEMVKDIITHPRLNDRLKYAVSHFSKTAPVPIAMVSGQSNRVALPPSVFGRKLSYPTTVRMCDLFPFHHHMLEIGFIEKFGFPKVGTTEEVIMNQDFLKYLKTYDGEEPKLVR